MKSRKRPQTQTQTAFRLPPDLVAKLDRIADRLSAERPGIPITRADVVRMLLTRAVKEEETRHGKA